MVQTWRAHNPSNFATLKWDIQSHKFSISVGFPRASTHIGIRWVPRHGWCEWTSLRKDSRPGLMWSPRDSKAQAPQGEHPEIGKLFFNYFIISISFEYIWGYLDMRYQDICWMISWHLAFSNQIEISGGYICRLGWLHRPRGFVILPVRWQF